MVRRPTGKLAKFAGRVVLVAGTAGGIGREIALAFSYQGAKVVVAARDRDGVEALAAGIREEGGTAAGLGLDPSMPEEVHAVVDETIGRFGRLDVLVNIAGVACGSRSLEEITPQEWDEVAGRPLRAAFLSTRASFAAMKDQAGGTIVQVAVCAAARTSRFGGPHNAAARAGILGFTRQVAREMSAHRIHVRAVGLSLIVGTPGAGALWDLYHEDEHDKFVREIPAGRMMADRDAASAVLAIAGGARGRFEGALETFGRGLGI